MEQGNKKIFFCEQIALSHFVRLAVLKETLNYENINIGLLQV